MSSIDWPEIIGWNDEALADLRCLGYAYLRQGKYDIAQSFFEVLVVITKNNPYDLRTLGGIYLEKGKNFQALTLIEESLKFDPGHASTLINRIKALFALGYRRQAIAQAKELITHADSTIASQASALLLAYT